MENISEAFNELDEKITRLKNSGEDEKVFSKNSPLHGDSLKEKLSASEEERLSKIREKFSHYQLPLSKEIEEDELSLLKAYELFIKVRDLDASVRSRTTFIEKTVISTPITKKSRYASETGFAFLQAWFIINHGEKAEKFIPEIVSVNGKSELVFTESASYRMPPVLKEILQAV